jgi:predicted TIM-barrel enzyme
MSPMSIKREEILARLHNQIAAGRTLLGAGAGSGLSAKAEEAGGVDLIVIYNSGRFRMAGYTSLAGLFAYGDANAMVVDMAREILPAVKDTPVIAGVNGTDPFRLMPGFLQQLAEMGFSGVHNFPTVGIFDGVIRTELEANGLGYDKEVEMITLAHRMGLFTSAYVFNPEEAAAMARGGADVIVPHVGLTATGAPSSKHRLSMDEAIEKTLRMAEAARAVRGDALVLCHGGPFDTPTNVAGALKRMPGVAGIYAASNVERLPAERGIQARVEAFKAM